MMSKQSSLRNKNDKNNIHLQSGCNNIDMATLPIEMLQPTLQMNTNNKNQDD